MPKSNILLSTLRSKTIAELHNGQNVMVIGIPATLSLTISCQIKIDNGYALDLLLIFIVINGALSLMLVIFDILMNVGLSIGGIPSLGGAPEIISLNLTECWLKSVLGHSYDQLLGLA